MWPFRRKPKPEPEPEPEPAREPAPAPSRPRSSGRTAADVLRQLEAEAPAEPPSRPDPAPPAPTRPVDPTVGRALLAEGPVTREFLHRQLRVAGKADSYLGKLLAGAGAPPEADLFAVLAAGYAMAEVDLKQCRVHVHTARSIPRELALKYKMVPIERIGDLLCVVCSGAPNPKGVEAIRRETGARVKMLRCPAHHLQILLRRLYAAGGEGAGRRASEAIAAVPIAREDYDEVTASAAARTEARWDSLYASSGPVRASRLARR